MAYASLRRLSYATRYSDTVGDEEEEWEEAPIDDVEGEDGEDEDVDVCVVDSDDEVQYVPPPGASDNARRLHGCVVL